MFRVLLLVAAIAGCAELPILVCPKDGGPPWYELTSAHFKLRTDAPRQHAHDVLREYEHAYAILAKLLEQYLPPGPLPADTDIVLFSQPADLKALVDGWLGGAFASGDRGRPSIVLSGAYDRELFQHELVHRFVRERVRFVAPWISEGLADYLSTAQAVKQELKAGSVPRGREIGEWRGHLPSPDRIARVGDYEFHHEFTASGYYLGAWALVHLLATDSHRDGQLTAFIRDVAEGADRAEAFERRFGKMETLTIPFFEHVDLIAEHPERLSIRLTASPSPSPSPSPEPAEGMPETKERLLDESEIHFLWAWLTTDRYEEQLDQVVAHFADVPSVHYERAKLLARRGYEDDALRELQRMVDLGAGERKWEHRRTSFAIDSAERHPEKLAALEPEVARMGEESSEPEILNKAAWYYGLRRQPARGLPLALRALAAKPGDVQCLDTLALLQYQNGEKAKALATMNEAFMRLREGRPIPAGMLDRLRMYGGNVAP
jgi:hypothetical protein